MAWHTRGARAEVGVGGGLRGLPLYTHLLCGWLRQTLATLVWAVWPLPFWGLKSAQWGISTSKGAGGGGG